MAQAKYFKVSAAWMKACGKGDEAKVFEVKAQDHNLVGGRGFDSFVTVIETDCYGVKGFTMDWVLAVARGEFVDAPAAPAETGAPAPELRTFAITHNVDGTRQSIQLDAIDAAAAQQQMIETFEARGWIVGAIESIRVVEARAE
jgi:hypothetical protein